MQQFESTNPGFFEHFGSQKKPYGLHIGLAIALALDVVLGAMLARSWGWW